MARPATLTVADTLSKSFLLSVKTRGDKTAMREKDLGIWRTISWNDWAARAREIAFALISVGFKPGDVASVLSNTVPEWNYADMGILCAGGVSSGIYPTDAAKQVEYLVNDSKTTVIFVEDDEQLDKVLEVGRVVMDDTCERLMNSKDIQEFYLGATEEGARGEKRWKRKKTWR